MEASYAARLDEAGAAVGRLLEAGGLSEPERAEALVALERLQATLDAARAAVLAPFDAARSCEADGARSTRAWLRWRCRTSEQRAGRLVAHARLLRDEPVLARALAAGTISAEHLAPLGRARATRPDAFATAVGEMLEIAAVARFDDFVRHLDVWRQLADPDGAEGDARADAETRRAHCSATWKGMRRLDALLDVVGGEILHRELDRLAEALFEADWADARARLGDAARASDLRRTAAQRRADALVEMAARSASYLPSAGRARPLVTVLVGYDAFVGAVLGSGTAITPGQLGGLLTEADVERVVFGAPSRVLDVGARRRFFDGATRRACEARDRGCTHPSCDVPVERCEVDHVRPFDGHNTVHANGECLCRWHHRRKHRHGPAP